MRPRLRKPAVFGGGALAVVVLIALALALARGPTGEPIHVTVPRGATLREIADSLAAHEIIRWPQGFRSYVRLVGADDDLQAGVYALRPGEGWRRTLRRMVEGDVVTVAITVPEGSTTRLIADRLAPVVGLPRDSIRAVLLDTASAVRFRVPGPTLEGYLYPETYRFALGLPLGEALAAIVSRYREVWTPERRARADSLGWSEQEVVSLASIIEAEALRAEELPLISAVYHNRLRRGMRLQADPTVQYTLPERKRRLLYRDIEATKDNPYNTYHHRGLPPGPIGSPSADAVDAALNPAPVPHLYFVARPDGSHVFSNTLRQHINAKNRIAREARKAARSRDGS